jgi:hypothetical protein
VTKDQEQSTRSVESIAHDQGTEPRRSLHLAASLYCDASCSTVKVRNMSASGALIEGGTVPHAGSLVQLVRGALIAHGLVAWSAEGQCGIRFSGRVNVEQWRATPTNGEQQRVDEVVRLVKAGAIPLPLPPLAEAPSDGRTPEAGEHVAGDLRRVAQLLDDLGGELSSDPTVVDRHARPLQNLDIAAQVLAAVEAILAGDRDVDATKLAGLRRSADEALRSQCPAAPRRSGLA